jgi:hypothetical protein
MLGFQSCKGNCEKQPEEKEFVMHGIIIKKHHRIADPSMAFFCGEEELSF